MHAPVEVSVEIRHVEAAVQQKRISGRFVGEPNPNLIRIRSDFGQIRRRRRSMQMEKGQIRFRQRRILAGE